MAKQTSNGKCNLCGGTFSKAAMTKHLESCKQRKGTSETSSGSRRPQKTKCFHLVAEGRYLPKYWMHLEVPVNADFEVLDNFLRRTWLECCGHMSMFTIEGKTYSCAPMEDLNDEGFDVKLCDVLHPGMKFYHEYDFGTTTHLTLKVISEREGESKGKSVQLLARNDPPSITCSSCGQPATQLCTECAWSDKGWLCNKCAADHKCDEDMRLPVVNSPRVGMCGYTG
jgi:hypothetical protein